MRTVEQGAHRPDLDRLVVVQNPVSARAKRIGRQIRRLQSVIPMPVTIIETSPHAEQTRERFAKSMHGDDRVLVMAGTGDGTASKLVEHLLLGEEFAGRRDTPVGFLAGGGASDIAHMLHTEQALRQPEHMLLHGVHASVHPLQCVITTPDGNTYTKLAVGYASLGASARSAYEINANRSHKPQPMLIQKFHAGADVYRGIVESPEFKYQQNGITNRCYEYTFPNGDRMAQFLRWQTDITRQGTQEVIVEEKRIAAISHYLGSSLMGRLAGVELAADAHRVFTLESETYMQHDGEAFLLSEGTTVDIGTDSELAFTALVTKQ